MQTNVSPENIERYVKELRATYQLHTHKEQALIGVLTLERLLTHVWTNLYGAGDKSTVVMPEHLPFALKDVPTLFAVASLQARISTLVTCAVATRPIVTICDLQQEICVAEGVSDYAELGLGFSLHFMPLVQQFFKLTPRAEVYPVSSRQVIDFLLHNEEAGHLLEGSGDTRDVINLFAKYYRHRTCGSRGARVNSRGLGIHIQNYSFFMTMLREQNACARHDVDQVCSEARLRVLRNRQLYRKTITALDAAIATSVEERTATRSSSSIYPSSTGGLSFDVTMPEEEARGTSIPLSLWNREETGRGLCLAVTLGSSGHGGGGGQQDVDRVSTSCATQQAVSCNQQTTHGSVSFPPVSEASPTAHARRRRGGVIRDKPEAAITVSATEIGPSPSTVLIPSLAFSMETPTCIHTEASTPARDNGEASTAAVAAAEPSHVELLLQACRSSEGGVDDVVDLLVSTPLGTVLYQKQLHDIFIHLAQLSSADVTARDHLKACSATPMIPLVAPVSSYLHSITSGDACAMEVVDMVSPEEVCWEPLRGPGIDAECNRLFSRSVKDIYNGPGLEDLLCSVLGVPRNPTVRCWLSSCDLNRRRYTSPSELNDVFSERFLRIMEHCIIAEYTYHLAEVEGLTNGSGTRHAGEGGEEALRRVLSALPEKQVAAVLPVFPLRHSWRRGADGLFFGGPHFFLGCSSGLRFRRVAAVWCTGAQQRTQVDALSFSEEPHFVVQAVLNHLGVRSLDASVRKTVSFGTSSIADALSTEMAADVHRRVAAVAPYAQHFVKEMDTEGAYGMFNDTVLKRLRTLCVVMPRDTKLREELRYMGNTYLLEQTLRLLYVPQHNTLYGEQGECSPAVLSDAVVPLFFPLPTTSGPRARLDDYLVQLFTSASRLPRGASVDEMDRALHADGFARHNATEVDFTWHVSVPPFCRYYAVYPPGTDGMSMPAPPLVPGGGDRTPGKSTHYPREADEAEAETRGASAENVRVSVSHLLDRVSHVSLPQWDISLFDEVNEKALQPSRGDGAGERGSTAVGRSSVHAGVNASVGGDEEDEEGEDGIVQFYRCTTAPLMKRRREETASGSQGSGGLYLPKAVGVADDTAPYAIAAEKFVYEELSAQYASDPSVSVVWVNAEGERGTPYDILVVRYPKAHAGSAVSRVQRPEVLSYVEVKSTTSDTRRAFEISLREFLFAARYGRAFKVYRVFGASTSAMRRMKVQVYEDIVTLWHTGRLTITGDVRVVPSF